MSERVHVLEDVPWKQRCHVGLNDIAVDRFGSFYVRQRARAFSTMSSGVVVPISRSAGGYAAHIPLANLVELFGDNVYPITAPVNVDILREWHKLRVAA